ncbi:MAG: enoyl-CoA hydratase/isomerase family protein [Porticoccaceae bacterium]|nr:enoyl-CoA hydratase/isomerase family protein [Porticoccaceae bacterium]MDG1473306.1 enoyl-CoA hydratase/isomerase family protein [Porticoccaceae bacterium]
MSNIITAIVAGVGQITLDRPAALNALTLDMVRDISTALLKWKNDQSVEAVAIRGSNQEGPFGAFCAGGDIRFFHRAGIAEDADLEAFFTEEYRLNHLIFNYPKPYLAFMDGIVMGGGMGISQGASLRLVTERTKIAMPETNIGLFPDVGGGYFLPKCPGYSGEYLGLSGKVLSGAEALAANLADRAVSSDNLNDLWDSLTNNEMMTVEQRISRLHSVIDNLQLAEDDRWLTTDIDRVFNQASPADILKKLKQIDTPWAQETSDLLNKRSPLMLHVSLRQIQLGRHMSLADELRLERSLVRHCFYAYHLARTGAATDTVEGIRALVIDKDNSPAWNPARIEDVSSTMVDPFFVSPWSAEEHPLADLD